MALTITSANAVYMLTILPLYPVPQQLQGYAADDAFTTEDMDTAETVMGVDGRMSAGWIPAIVVQGIMLMPDSPSAPIFETWYTSQLTVQEIFYATATIAFPGVQRKYSLSQGVLKKYNPIAGAKKVLERRSFSIDWGSVLPAIY